MQTVSEWLELGNDGRRDDQGYTAVGEAEEQMLEDVSTDLRTHDAVDGEHDSDSEYVTLATDEACAVAAEMARSLRTGMKEDDVGDGDGEGGSTPLSSRGISNFTVGLVGKPSAGKSTFFNAVTRVRFVPPPSTSAPFSF